MSSITKNILIEGKHNKPIVTDVFFETTNTPKPIIIFCHGYKGFKDWGAWNLMADAYSKAGFFFIKFNFSHNGGTAEQPIDFPDLEAFGQNNFTKELDDLKSVLDWICASETYKKEVNTQNISLLAHSRGGGISCIKTEEDSRIKNVITLAGVSDYKVRFNENTEGFKLWQETGITYIENGRTKQQMPHYFQFYTNFIENENRFTIKRAVENLTVPHLIIHGTQDSTVSLDEAKNLHKWNAKSKLEIIDGADHVFGASHPWNENTLPTDLEKAIENSIAFLKK